MSVSSQPRQKLGNGARLVIFASRLGAVPSNPVVAEEVTHLGGLELLDGNQKLITALPGVEELTPDDVQHGRAAWSFELEPGGYLLNWPADDLGPDHRALQSLWLAKDWTTLLFANAPRKGGSPDRRTLSIQMCRGEFQPYENPGTTAAELALASLRSNRRQLGDEHLHRLLHGKFENPMLGLLGAHMLLERGSPKRELLAEIIGNLGTLLGSHPDVSALAYIARRRFEIDLPDGVGIKEAPEFPPMFRAGLAEMINAEWEENRPMRIGPVDSLARFHLSPDEPWTFFWRSLRVGGMSDEYWIQTAREAATRLACPWDQIAPAVWEAISPLKQTAADFLFSLIGTSASTQSGALAENESDLGQRLRAFANQLLQQKGADVLRQLKPEHLRWTGVSPEQAAVLLNELQSWTTKLFVTEQEQNQEKQDTHS
jgi:hypothetical protein